MDIEDALAQFRDAAIKKGKLAGRPASTGATTRVDHQQYERMAEAYRALVAMGEAGLDAFASMLGDESPYVREWVASQLLCAGDKRAKNVLVDLGVVPGLVGFTSRITLSEYEKGTLRPPFQVENSV